MVDCGRVENTGVRGCETWILRHTILFRHIRGSVFVVVFAVPVGIISVAVVWRHRPRRDRVVGECYG